MEPETKLADSFTNDMEEDSSKNYIVKVPNAFIYRNGLIVTKEYNETMRVEFLTFPNGDRFTSWKGKAWIDDSRNNRAFSVSGHSVRCVDYSDMFNPTKTCSLIEDPSSIIPYDPSGVFTEVISCDDVQLWSKKIDDVLCMVSTNITKKTYSIVLVKGDRLLDAVEVPICDNVVLAFQYQPYYSNGILFIKNEKYALILDSTTTPLIFATDT